jgi:hypothetical protein
MIYTPADTRTLVWVQNKTKLLQRMHVWQAQHQSCSLPKPNPLSLPGTCKSSDLIAIALASEHLGNKGVADVNG